MLYLCILYFLGRFRTYIWYLPCLLLGRRCNWLWWSGCRHGSYLCKSSRKVRYNTVCSL